MKEMFLNVNKKFIFAAMIAIFCLSFSALFQTLFVIKNNSFNLSSFQIYITNILRVFSAFLIVPLFTFKNKDLDKNSNSFVFGILIICGIMLLILMMFSPLIVEGMKKANKDSISNSDIWNYVILSNISSIIALIESYFIYNMIFQNRLNESIFYSVMSLVLKVFFTTLLITSLSPFEFKFWFIALANVCSVGLMFLVLSIDYIYRNKNNNNINFQNIFLYYKRGLIPGLEELIGTLVYVFFTLSVIDHSTMDWAAWNLSNTIMLWGIMNVTLIFRYSLYYETMNRSDNNFRDSLQNNYLIFNVIIFSLLTVFYYSLIPLFINGSTEWDHREWIKLTRQTLLGMFPFMLMLETKKQFEIKLINTNRFYFILLNTVLDAFLIKIPMGILWKMNVIEIDYWSNLIIWGFGITLVLSLTTIEYIFLRHNPSFNLKEWIISKQNK